MWLVLTTPLSFLTLLAPGLIISNLSACAPKMLFTQQLALMQLMLFATCTAAGTTNIAVYQFPPFINATEGESVTLNCAMASERNLSPIGSAHWTRGKPNGYKLDDSPFYSGRLQKADSESFAKNIIFIKISDLTEKDADTYYCHIDVMGVGVRDGKGTKLQVRRRIQREDLKLGLVLGGVLVLLAITIIILTIRLIWQNKVIQRLKRNHSGANTIDATADLQPTTQVHSNRGSDEAVSLHYAKVNTKQEGKSRRMNMQVHHVEYATIR